MLLARRRRRPAAAAGPAAASAPPAGQPLHRRRRRMLQPACCCAPAPFRLALLLAHSAQARSRAQPRPHPAWLASCGPAARRARRRAVAAEAHARLPRPERVLYMRREAGERPNPPQHQPVQRHTAPTQHDLSRANSDQARPWRCDALPRRARSIHDAKSTPSTRRQLISGAKGRRGGAAKLRMRGARAEPPQQGAATGARQSVIDANVGESTRRPNDPAATSAAAYASRRRQQRRLLSSVCAPGSQPQQSG